MKRHERISHGSNSHENEEDGGDLADAVSKVQETHGETAEDDGEVEPGEEGSFVGEEDFRFKACGQRDAFAWSRIPGQMSCVDGGGGRMRGSLTWRSLEERLCGHVDGGLCVVVVTMPMAGWLPGRMDVTGGGRRSRVAGRRADGVEMAVLDGGFESLVGGWFNCCWVCVCVWIYV